MTICQFAKALGCRRSRIYSIFNCKSIDTDTLIRISKILEYNFLLEYFREDEPPASYFILAEVDSSKIEAINSGSSLKIIKTWNSV